MTAPHKHHACPVWIGWLLLNPLRRLLQDPRKILAPCVRPGMRALDFGCAMGFFTLPLAELVGPTGRVYAVDVQDGMLDQLKRRAARRGLSGRIFIRRCGHEDFGLQEFEGAMDFILAFAVIHEVPDVQRLLAAFHRALKPGGTLLIAEPKGHVDGPAFEAEVRIAKETGFILRTTPRVGCAYAALLAKQ